MILNHKDAITFIMEHSDLFESTLVFATLEELHRIIGNNLGIDTGIRLKPVRITASNYLQTFEDGNKRTGRMLANALLISSIGRGFSLRNTDARSLALAYLAFYEFNSIRGLTNILKAEL